MRKLYEETKFMLNKYHIKPNKNLGQNFLIDDEVVAEIIDSANISKDDLVIEIGPGLGTLTKELLERAKKVVCIELDERMLQILEDRFCLYTNLEIMHQDVLKVDLKELIGREKVENQVQQVKIVANLPYYITTPIIMKLLEDKLEIESITVMIQKEVAQRLTAIPGSKNAGAITYSVAYYAKPESVLVVPNTSFIPPPEVESEVIRLEIRQTPAVTVKKEDLFFQIIKLSFMQRRKTLLNGLVNGKIGKTKEQLESILKELAIDPKIRGEALTIDQFADLANKLAENKAKKE